MKTLRNYYRIEIPGDAFDTLEEAAEHAIQEARERAVLYCIPCEWNATHLSGEVGDFTILFRVKRTRYAK